MKMSCKFHKIPGTQSRVITKVHDLLGQPSYNAPQFVNHTKPLRLHAKLYLIHVQNPCLFVFLDLATITKIKLG